MLTNMLISVTNYRQVFEVKTVSTGRIMGRKILAVIVALVVAIAIIMISQMLTTLAVQPPSSVLMGDAEAMREYMAKMPGVVFAIVCIGYAIASFAGGFIVAKMSRQQGSATALAVIVGVVLTLSHIANVSMRPHPLWFIIVGLLIFIPISIVGHRFAR